MLQTNQNEENIRGQWGCQVPTENERVGDGKDDEIEPRINNPGPKPLVFFQRCARSDNKKEGIDDQADADPGDAEGQVTKEGGSIVL